MRSDVPIIAVICILIGDRGVLLSRVTPRWSPVSQSLRLATRRRYWHSHHWHRAGAHYEREGGVRTLGWLTYYYLCFLALDGWAIHRFRT